MASSSLNIPSFKTPPVEESDEWWISRLGQRLNYRRQGDTELQRDLLAQPERLVDKRHGLVTLAAWYQGEPPPPANCTEDYVQAWRSVLKRSRLNMAETVVSSISDRLVPSGWRTGGDDDADGDQVAQELADELDLVNEASQAIEDMLWSGRGYLLVSGAQEGTDTEVITRESPLYTYVEKSKITRKPLAGIRVVQDDRISDAKRDRTEIWLYRPGYVRVGRFSASGEFKLEPRQELPDEDYFPMVELRNRRDQGEFERHLDSLSRLNDSMFNRLILTKLQAHRQRALQKDAKYLETDDVVEVNKDDFVSGPDTLWDLPPGVTLWESSAADLSQVRMIVQDDIKFLCAASGTPLADAVPDAANQSAKGSQIIEDKYLFRIQDRQRRADRALAQVLSLIFQLRGDTERAQVHKIRTIWEPIQRYGLQEKTQAAAVVRDVMPNDWIATNILQVRPADLPSIDRMRISDQLLAPTAPVAPAPAAPAAPTAPPDPTAPPEPQDDEVDTDAEDDDGF